MVSALASSSLGVPRWEVSDVLRLVVRDWDLLKEKGKEGWGRQAWEVSHRACPEARLGEPSHHNDGCLTGNRAFQRLSDAERITHIP